MSSISADSPLRGGAASFRQPLSGEDLERAQALMQRVFDVNVHEIDPRLHDIIYRSSSREYDIRHHVYRWTDTSYEVVFRDGFQARPQGETPDNVYYNLEDHVHHGGAPLDPNPRNPHAFVSTTLNSGWFPSVGVGEERDMWRYEIYAPGGIWVRQTLGDANITYQFPGQDEVAFIAGIAPQYIRSAQLFRLSHPQGSLYSQHERVEPVLVINTNFNPQSHPPRRINIANPTHDRYEGGENHVPLRYILYPPPPPLDDTSPPPHHDELKREISDHHHHVTKRVLPDPPTSWYWEDVANVESYIDAAFRSSCRNEAYLFMKNEYVHLYYAPRATNDEVLNGPLLISDGFPCLEGTPFGEYGIDCAFGCHVADEAFIFSGNLCAQINIARGTKNGKIIKGPMTISMMFPFFKGTVFEHGLDAAFESTSKDEAYLFKGNQYARINYGSNPPQLLATGLIRDGFPGLKDTIFKTDIQAAFASHIEKEAYLFNGDIYGHFHFGSGTGDDYLVGGKEIKILPDAWSSLRNILPRRNRGLDCPPIP